MQLARELSEQGHAISHVCVAALLKDMGYSLQGNRKTLEGASHPDRNAQFEFINDKTQAALGAAQPVISVDTKKKELVGRYKNGGKEWMPAGEPEQVKVHDFVDVELGRANPYGVYDLANNTGWVSVGTDHDTASFAVATIRRWWFSMAQATYPAATELMIMADGGYASLSRALSPISPGRALRGQDASLFYPLATARDDDQGGAAAQRRFGKVLDRVPGVEQRQVLVAELQQWVRGCIHCSVARQMSRSGSTLVRMLGS